MIEWGGPWGQKKKKQDGSLGEKKIRSSETGGEEGERGNKLFGGGAGGRGRGGEKRGPPRSGGPAMPIRPLKKKKWVALSNGETKKKKSFLAKLPAGPQRSQILHQGGPGTHGGRSGPFGIKSRGRSKFICPGNKKRQEGEKKGEGNKT